MENDPEILHDFALALSSFLWFVFVLDDFMPFSIGYDCYVYAFVTVLPNISIFLEAYVSIHQTDIERIPLLEMTLLPCVSQTVFVAITIGNRWNTVSRVLFREIERERAH